jgi:DNA integrity scanning protein DisA with diadenylate cyclase activity
LPNDLMEIVVSIFYTTLAIDAFMTIRELISLRSIIVKLNSISDELSGKVVYNIGYLRDEIEEIRNNKSIDIFKEEVKQYFEKLDNIKDVLEEKKNEINDNILQVIQRKDIELSEKQLRSIHHFNILLERSKQYSRFYRNYPKASSKRYAGILHALKYKRTHEK